MVKAVALYSRNSLNNSWNGYIFTAWFGGVQE